MTAVRGDRAVPRTWAMWWSRRMLLRALALLLIASALVLAAQEDGSAAEPKEHDETEMVARDDADRDALEVPALSARGLYNLGLARLEAGDAEAAAAAFLSARDGAGPDPTLRYRAAFNLGLALAAQADARPEDGEDAAPEAVIETLRQSAAWFNDAVRLAPPGDDDARVNLELVSRRILALADQLNEGNRLEARLDRLIDDQRSVRDQLRRLLADVDVQQASAEPLGFRSAFEGLASRERMLLAEVGDCIDLASEERLLIEQTPEAQRSPEQRNRAYQLMGLTDYLERARQSLSDARRRLRRLEGERGHRRADAALAELKRAREQLFDPLAVLKAVARDERELIGHTDALATFADGAVRLRSSPRPAWLTSEHLADRQEDVGVRTGGVLGRFEAAAVPGAATGDGAAELTPEASRTLRAVAAATPILDGGLAAMRDAIAALESDQPAAALGHQSRALAALQRSIEEFADTRGLIELAYAGQQNIGALLTPPEDGPAEELAVDDRAALVTGIGADNQRRLERLRTLLDEDAQRAVGEAQDEEAQQAAGQLYERAETLRSDAEAGLAALLDVVPSLVAEGGDPARAVGANGDTLAALEELRRLFFSIVEHLRELHAEQAETHDRTATLQFEATAGDAVDLAATLGLVAERQTRHGPFGDALAAALARQADAANAAPAADAAASGGGAAQGARFAEAAEEVRQAGGRMHSAAAMLADAAERAVTMSPELEPALEDQLAALDHLQNALRALTPPQNPQGDDGQQQQGEQPQQDPGDEPMSQRQALKRLQAIRDREAQRQRRRRNEAAPVEPVEKDW